MSVFDVLKIIGGLALFLYGMRLMGDSLSAVAGGKLEHIIGKLTSTKWKALILGCIVTAIIQSSSATTVMVVGFVNAGIMHLSQAVGIIMGANIGTTITSWILSLTGIKSDVFWLQILKPSSFSPILASIGVIFMMTSQDGDKKRNIGNILLGFSILMMGMETMSTAASPLAENESFIRILTAFSNPVLGIGMGALLTAIIQSSSASIGILQALCNSGIVNYGSAIPIILGQNIGTCITCILSSIGTSKNAKRAALLHLYFNLIGTILFIICFYSLNTFFPFEFLFHQASAAGIACIHSLFNIICAFVLYPFSEVLIQMTSFTIKEEKLIKKSVKETFALDERFLETPSVAMEMSRNTTKLMAKEAMEALEISISCLEHFDSNQCQRVRYLEQRVNQYDDQLTHYLVKCSARNLSKEDSESLTVLLHMISDFERISDHAISIIESAEIMKVKNLNFSNSTKTEFSVLIQALKDICNDTLLSFQEDDIQKASHMEALKDVIHSLIKEIKQNHMYLVRNGECTIELGVILEDILNNMKRVSDHCSNIAGELIDVYGKGFEKHDFYTSLDSKNRILYENEVQRLKNKYLIVE